MGAMFVGLAVWQLVAALVGHGRDDGWQRHVMRVGALCRVLAYAYFAFAAARLALQLDRRARDSERRLPIVVLGQVGYVAKGLAFVVIGVLLALAAVTRDADKTGGLDESLYQVLGHAWGGVAIVVVGVGIGCFGLFLFARAWHLNQRTRLEPAASRRVSPRQGHAPSPDNYVVRCRFVT
jgi:MFS family permease